MILTFIVSALATWRICVLMARDDGPFNVFKKLRTWIIWRNFQTLIGVFGCIGCLSVYVGLFVALIAAPVRQNVIDVGLYGLALSSATIFLEIGQQTLKRIAMPPPF